MLSSASRMRSAADFKATFRAGVRAGRPTVVVHARPALSPSDVPETRVGFVVSKAVGNAVTRNRVKRRLRHMIREQMPSFPQPVHMVVRALPGADTEPDRLADDLSSALGACWRKLAAQQRPHEGTRDEDGAADTSSGVPSPASGTRQ